MRFSRLPGDVNTTPRVHVLASSGLTFGLPRGISFSDWKNGSPGRTKPLGPAGPNVDPPFVSKADCPSLAGLVSLRLMISRQRVCTAKRFGFCCDVTPRRSSRCLARVAVEEVADGVEPRARKQLLGVRLARSDLVAAADAHGVRRRPIGERLPRVDAAGPRVVRIAVAELEVQALGRRTATRRRPPRPPSRPLVLFDTKRFIGCSMIETLSLIPAGS